LYHRLTLPPGRVRVIERVQERHHLGRERPPVPQALVERPPPVMLRVQVLAAVPRRPNAIAPRRSSDLERASAGAEVERRIVGDHQLLVSLWDPS
jgi:hypothetical protein